MKVIADITVLPLGVGLSLSKYVAVCEKILSDAGLQTRLHANGTNVEGDLDAFFAAVKTCHETLHAMGVPRISTDIKVGTRIDKEQTMGDKVRSVETRLHPEAGGRK